jgi:indolepyruvate ferredoxin oxidoreductase beta subunit
MSHVRAARDATPGPLVPEGLMDIVVAFEPIEALRILAEYGRETTRVLVNPRPVYPLAVQVGEATYPDPDELVATLRRLAAEILVVESTELARQAGEVRAQNLALLGELAGSGWLPVEAATLEALLADRFADEVLCLNRAAFRLGLEAARALAASR